MYVLQSMQKMRKAALVLPDLLVFACAHADAADDAAAPGTGRSTLVTVTAPHVRQAFRRWEALDPTVMKALQLGSYFGVCAQSNFICCFTEARLRASVLKCGAGGDSTARCVMNFARLSKEAWCSSTW